MLTIKLYKYNKQRSLKSLQNLSINPIFSVWKAIISAYCTKCLIEPSFFILLATQFLKLMIYFIREISYLLWEIFIIKNLNIHKYLNAYYWIIFIVLLCNTCIIWFWYLITKASYLFFFYNINFLI